MMKQQLTQLAANVWLWPCSKNPQLIQPSIGVIASQRQTLLVDAGNGPVVVEQIRRAIQRANLPDVSGIIYTHHHWDHVYGACVFQVPVFAHEKCCAILQDEACKPWSAKYLEQLAAQNPKLTISCKARARAVRDWETFHIAVPDQVFSATAFIDLDGIQVELMHVGGQHAEDSIVVRVPQAKIMYIGDCYYPPPLHRRPPGAIHSFTLLRAIVDEAYDIYIEGHADPVSRQAYLKILQRS